MQEKITPKTFEKSKFYDSQDVGLGYIFALLAPLIVSLLVLIICQIIISQGVEADVINASKAYKVVSMLTAPIGFSVMFFAFNRARKKSIKAAKVKFKIGWGALICFAISLVCVFGLQYLIGGVDFLLQLTGYNISSLPIPLDNFGWYVLAVVIAALLPAIFEELIFRGIILNGLKSSLGEIGAIMLSAAMFALMHMRLEQLIYPFILGIILGWVATRMNSTFASMLVHFFNNFIVITLQYITVATGWNMNLNYRVWWSWILAIALSIVAAAVIYLIEKFYFKHKNKNVQEIADETPQEKKKISLLVWVGMGISAFILIINTVIGFMPAA